MSILGIDYGAKKIGLAKSDENNKFALPLETVANVGKSAVFKQLKSICQQHGVNLVVVGVPVSLSSSQPGIVLRQKDFKNKQMQEVLAFVEWLKQSIGLPVEIEDERLSTKMANRLQKQLVKENGDDPIAAMVILQSYLDRQQLAG